MIGFGGSLEPAVGVAADEGMMGSVGVKVGFLYLSSIGRLHYKLCLFLDSLQKRDRAGFWPLNF
jgi:hypothetical protein